MKRINKMRKLSSFYLTGDSLQSAKGKTKEKQRKNNILLKDNRWMKVGKMHSKRKALMTLILYL